MNRMIVVLAVAAGIIVAACGSTARAGNATAASPTPDRGAQLRNGAAGQLVQINGQTLILTAATGDLTVTFTGTTTFTRTSNAVLADIVSGLCIADPWMGDRARGIPPWRDVGVELRGPCVADTEHAFARSWREGARTSPLTPSTTPARTLSPVTRMAKSVVIR